MKTIKELNEYALLHNVSYGYDKRHNINKISRYDYMPSLGFRRNIEKLKEVL